MLIFLSPQKKNYLEGWNFGNVNNWKRHTLKQLIFWITTKSLFGVPPREVQDPANSFLRVPKGSGLAAEQKVIECLPITGETFSAVEDATVWWRTLTPRPFFPFNTLYSQRVRHLVYTHFCVAHRRPAWWSRYTRALINTCWHLPVQFGFFPTSNFSLQIDFCYVKHAIERRLLG